MPPYPINNLFSSEDTKIKSTDEDDSINDSNDAIIEDDINTDDYDSTDSEATTDDDASNDVDDSGSDLAYIALCENYISELRFGFTHVRMDGTHKTFAPLYANVITDFTLEKLKRFHQTHVFKVNYGFVAGGRFLVDLFNNDYEYLYLYSNMYKCKRSQFDK